VHLVPKVADIQTDPSISRSVCVYAPVWLRHGSKTSFPIDERVLAGKGLERMPEAIQRTRNPAKL
jgi:hypothetical protein